MSLTLTPQAATKIKEQGGYLRVTVKSGGCSGLRYLFAIVPHAAPTDLVFTSEGACVVTDPLSLNFIDGAIIDFHEELMGSSFVIRNPKAANSCGCGDSFTPVNS
jgi:iron-sulfur cluster assembly accessory protein